MFDQQKHPELKKDEKWLTNTTLEDYKYIGLQIKRMGSVA